MCAFRFKTTSDNDDALEVGRRASASAIEYLGKSMLRRILCHVSIGRLQVLTPAGTSIDNVAHAGNTDRNASLQASLVIHRWRMLWRLLRHGDIGFAESYIDGDWSSPDIAALIAIAAHNRAALDRTVSGSRWRHLSDRFSHLRRANTRAGSKRNIVAHYDLGNAFYARWLDPDMSYSSALYDSADDPLEDAQARKLDAIIAKLNLRGGERVLEIGCGWGQLSKRLAQAGAQVLALTLSPAQLAGARQRLADAGLADQVEVRLQDYRDVEGRFDRIVSIEMFEAVGQAYWPTYFSQLSALLLPGGEAVLQVITIDENRFESYRKDVDFIQRYVFPGGMLPTPSHIARLAETAGLVLDNVQRFGASYALTLAEWHRRFQREWPVLTQQGFDERFKRLWEYYLKYCEGGFAAEAIDVGFYSLKQTAAPVSG